MKKNYAKMTIQNQENALLRKICLLAFCCLCISQGYATIRYVAPSGSGNGSSWLNASGDIAAMISASAPGDEVWIKKGTYTPAATLGMKNGVAIYGGFAGTEVQLSERNFATNPTIINGQGNKLVFSNSSLDATAVLDGCTISNGYGGFAADGGGMSNYTSQVTIRNCVFANNKAVYGGGMYNSNSNPTISNCVFAGNQSLYNSGGAMYNSNSSPNISNSVFTGNSSAAHAGAIHNTSSYSPRPASPTITNCVFTGNTAADNGGAMYNYNYSYPTITNSIIYGNTARLIASISNSGGATPIINYSDIQGGYAGTGNLDTDPLFVNATTPAGSDGIWMTADDGLALFPCSSPVINMGTTPTPALPTDILGNARVETYDMGAYESSTSANSTALSDVAISVTKIQQPITNYFSDCLHNVCTIMQNGSNPVRNTVTAKVWIDNTQNPQFVKRHYEITPADQPNDYGGTVTLYFTQQEFTDFNAVNTVKLPTSAIDAAGKANLLIEKRSGVSTNGSGLPGTYTGTIETINPVDANIIWNANSARWEVTFDVRGFSGFFVKTQLISLPVSFGALSASIQNNKLTVNWQTLSEINNDHFEIEASQDGVNFTTIATVTSKAQDGNSSTTLQYSWEADSGALVAFSGLGIVLLILLLPVAHRYKKQLLMVSVVLFMTFISCSKRTDSLAENTGDKYFIRIAQVDKDGGKTYSKMVRVVN
ncbi:choice-of-anchor Q domain-containing protein [Niabella drilacis]|uniref:Polymorphic outer membrane protein repeat-containing protein n=1 Tax=Niabella drilacis (strain DSM 25811 / CCM 8410 / CCUG 62505 / LMG 26954 / E90) TaxID=1285928 RepID=A0A1G7ASQ3_NIADE|nr:choice-of-anchor Q domain-containing protein [Niabella drilacis]SDE16956.1 polymorphic outer membrane protein repeat-containing protein [Niabella drilacis]